MRILLNMAAARGAGSSTVCRNVLRGLSQVGATHEFVAWTPESWKTDRLQRVTCRPTRPGIVGKLVAENASIRKACRTWNADRLFSLGDTSLPGCRLPHLLLIHQAHLAYEPSEWSFRVPLRQHLKMELMAAYFRLGIGSVDTFTVQTNHMKRRLATRWGIAEERIAVIPSALEDAPPPRRSPLAPPPGSPYLSYVAGPGAHKNHAVLPEMMAALHRKFPDLLCVLTVRAEQVPWLTRRATKLGVADRFSFMGEASRAEIEGLLRGSLAAVIPSKLESFGLPYLEAMRAGVPLVVSDRDCAREMCGEAARYADSDSGASFAAEVETLLSSEADRAECSALGKARFDRINVTWCDICSRYLGILESM